MRYRNSICSPEIQTDNDGDDDDDDVEEEEDEDDGRCVFVCVGGGVLFHNVVQEKHLQPKHTQIF